MAIFFILIAMVTATYPNIGGSDSTFSLGSGNINENLDYEVTGVRNINTPKFTPFVADLNNDSINEILVVDGSTLKLYQGQTLSEVDGLTVNCTGTVNTIDLNDLDNDGNIEIFLADETNELICIARYNGTDFKEIKNHDLSGLTHNDGEMLIKCGNDDCLLAYSEQDTQTSTHFYGVGFDLDSLGTQTTLKTRDGSYSTGWCFPTIRTASFKDYDGDTNEEFIFTNHEFRNTVAGEYNIFYVDVNSTLHANTEQVIERFAIDFDYTGGQTCSNHRIGRYVTPPLVYDLSLGGELETVIGIMDSSDTFKMNMYDNTGSLVDDYPEIFYADGEIVSDVILTNAFTDTGKVDFCVLGYERSVEEIDLLCASEKTSQIPETEEFKLDVSDLWNITESYTGYDIISHSTLQEQTLTSGTNLDEIVTTYGVLRIDYTAINELETSFINPKGDGVVIIADVENNGLSDMLVLTSTNLWYIDDGFTNSPANIDEIYTNPCVDAVWKLNTSVEVRITPTDTDGDTVRAKAILYEGESFEQDSGWSSFVSSGSTLTFSFKANHTGANYNLKLMATDSENNATIDEIEYSYSVATNGVSFGDCTTSLIGIVDSEIPISNVTTEPTANNIIDEQMQEVNDRTGLGTTIIWLIIMAIVGGALFTYNRQVDATDDKVALMVIGFVETILFVIGVKQSYISTGTLWTLILLSILVIGVVVTQRIFLHRGGGNV